MPARRRGATHPRRIARSLASPESLERRRLLAATDLAAFFRSGQTFLTWTEDAGITGEQYHVYRSHQPITSANLAQAERLTGRWGPLDDDTSRHYLAGQGAPANFVIRDLATPLGDSQGLFVHTVQAGSAGSVHYAVTQVTGGVEDRTIVPGRNATVAAIAERVETPQPVLVATQNGGLGRVYTQFMDDATWNPTYQGSAYNYSVALPRGYDPAVTYPLKLELHAYGGRYRFEPEAEYGWPTIQVFADDPAVAFPGNPGMVHTWWYGFAADHDFRTGDPPTAGRIANFTESRVLKAVDEVMGMFRVDAGLVHAFGHSMGGSGSLSLGLRYGNVFSAIYASEPMTSYATSPTFTEEFVSIWGPKAANLPILNLGPHAAHLAAYSAGGSEPTGVWDWMNHPRQLAQSGAAGTSLIMFGHGKLDRVIDWQTQGRPFIEALTRARVPFTAEMRGNWEHSWMGFGGAHHAMASRGYGDLGDFILRNESLPAIGFATGSGPLVPANTGTDLSNLGIVWGTASNAVGAAIVDEPARYEITLASTGAAQTADVTPRRFQQFVATPGATYRFENRDAASGAILAAGDVTADAFGRIVIPGLVILGGSGVRLSLAPAEPSSPPPPAVRRAIDWLPTTADGRVYAFSDQLPISSLTDAQIRFAAASFVGSQKQTAAEIARLRAIDPDFALLHYRLATASSGYPYILDTGTWGGDWTTVTAQEEWFEHSIVTGSRLHSPTDDWDVHDITNPDFRRYWIESTIAAMRATGAQGTFADSFTAGISGLLGHPAGDPRFDGTGALDGPWEGPNWLDRLADLTQEITAAYRATPEGFVYIPNIGPMTTSWATLDLAAIDGAMLELFAMDAPGYRADAAEYAAAMNRVLPLSRAGKAMIMQPGLLGGLSGTHRGFIVGTYFLLKGDRTYLNIVDGDSRGMYWYPEYGIDLGAPITATAATMRDYDLADGVVDQVYRRDFAGGRVIVNGADVTRTVHPGVGEFVRVVGTGGGAVAAGHVAADGSYAGGSLVRTAVTGPVTLAPGESLILVGGPAVDPPAVLPFPAAVLPGVQVGTLPAAYETSGLVWHERLQRIFAVSDSGIVTSMNRDGTDMVHWAVPGDLEGITVADPASDFIYIGVEHPDAILEFNVSTGQVARRFTLTQWMQGPDNQGLEGLAFVPVADHAEGGVFYAGLQADGRIYTFELPVAASRVATAVSYGGTITLDPALTDIADLSYDRATGLLLSLYDGANRLIASTPAGTRLAQWTVPGVEQEAVMALDGAMFIGEDQPTNGAGRILRYAPFSLPSLPEPPVNPPPPVDPPPVDPPPPTPITAAFAALAASRRTPTSAVSLAFSGTVTGLDRGDFVLTRNGVRVSLSRTTLAAAGDGRSFTLRKLDDETRPQGVYVLTLRAGGSGIAAVDGGAFTTDVLVTWTVDRTPPTAAFTTVLVAAGGPATSVTATFSKPVSGVSVEDFRLTRGGDPIQLVGVVLTVVDQRTYTLSGLGSLSAVPGTYRLRLVASRSAIVDAAGNAFTRSIAASWSIQRVAIATAR
jgi:hypothetical protein